MRNVRARLDAMATAHARRRVHDRRPDKPAWTPAQDAEFTALWASVTAGLGDDERAAWARQYAGVLATMAGQR